ncbi:MULTISPECIES: hypothetical protein [Metabacillus]|jgi:hypothetical protein|uniref:Uncharacterized protein n=1 Tax=Metabacillus rhizolycopersici TaxID=2875709 RepID=A0ABS7UQQ9_9BACI|nr:MULTISPECIES: hypothetical protein [Metabacillus]MBZ5750559.1 hypothetical protein [Metabacillus rhizolycopersici]MCM3653215.1 hypothetical protein [Metabacillus litoralis]
MSNIILKHYFLEETDRIKMEELMCKFFSENEEEILGLDDQSLKDLYNKMMVEQPSFLLTGDKHN